MPATALRAIEHAYTDTDRHTDTDTDTHTHTAHIETRV